MYPARWFFRNHEEEPTTEVAMRRGARGRPLRRARRLRRRRTSRRRCRSSSTRSSTGSGSASASWRSAPSSRCCRSARFAFAAREDAGGGGGDDRGARCCSCCCPARTLVAGTRASAAATTSRTSFYARTDFEKQLQNEIVCTCGVRPRSASASAARIRAPPRTRCAGVAALIDEGKSHDEIIQAFVARYGSEEMLGAPIDTGFNRLAWLFPYLVRRHSGVGRSACRGRGTADWTSPAP